MPTWIQMEPMVVASLEQQLQMPSSCSHLAMARCLDNFPLAQPPAATQTPSSNIQMAIGKPVAARKWKKSADEYDQVQRRMLTDKLSVHMLMTQQVGWLI